jgi:tricorn protease
MDGSEPTRVLIDWVCTEHAPVLVRGDEAVDALQDWDLHPLGCSLVLTLRGKILSMGGFDGPVVHLDWRMRGRRASARYCRDGRRVVAVSDHNGEEELIVFHEDGSDDPRSIRLPPGVLGRPTELQVSPNFKRPLVALVNHRGELLVVDLNAGQHKLVDTSQVAEGLSDLAWSLCGQFLAYCCALSEVTSVIKIVEVDDFKKPWKGRQVTEPVLVNRAPRFSPCGRYLYFISSRDFCPRYDGMLFQMAFEAGDRPYLILLQAEGKNPFMPSLRPPREEEDDLSDESGSDSSHNEDDSEADAERTVVDWENISQRLLAFPVENGRYSSVIGVDASLLGKRTCVMYVRSQMRHGNDFESVDSDEEADGALYLFELGRKKERLLVDGVEDVVVSMDGLVMCVELSDGRLQLLPTAQKARSIDDDDEESDDEGSIDQPGRATGFVDVAGRVVLHVDPAAEWETVFNEASRVVRDQFWRSDAIKSKKWEGICNNYRALLARLGSRDDLSDLLEEMFSELGSSHMYIYGPGEDDIDRPPRLGCAFSWDERNRGYVVSAIVRGDVWDRRTSGPLARPGVAVRSGDVVVAIDGKRLSEAFGPEQCLETCNGREVRQGRENALGKG